ncbi:glycosyltransferase family 39 protein [soil metagenome]
MIAPVVSRRLRIVTFAFFAAYLLLGVAAFRDYGISWDEIPTRQFGIMYVTHQVPNVAALNALRAEKGPAYERFGPLFEIILVRAETLMFRADVRTVFYMRHFATFLLFFLGVVFFHRLCRDRFGGWLALVGCLLLVLSPQLFSHSFYNVKDIAFLTMFVGTMLTMRHVVDRPERRTMVYHVANTVILLGTRVLGVFAMLLTGAAALAKRPSLRTLLYLIGYGVVVAVMLPLVWPVLWIDYVNIVRDAVLGTTTNPYYKTDLFRGQLLSASSLPWDYVPTWIMITTPIPVLLLFTAGTVASVRDIAQQPWAFVRGERQIDLTVLAWFFMPVLGCIVLKPIMYDAWRHLFFVYPALVYIALLGVEAVVTLAVRSAGEARRRMVHATAAVVLFVVLAPVALFMLRNHPFEHVYFNRFAGADMKEVKQRYELDYWGLSYRKLLEYVVHTDTSSHIRIFTATYPGRVNVAMLPRADRNRVELVASDADADYVMTNYRFHPQDYPYANEVFSVRVGNASIGSVFRLKRPGMTAPASPGVVPVGPKR